MRLASASQFFLAFSSTFLLACGAEHLPGSNGPPEEVPGSIIDQGPISRPSHPNKQVIGKRESCNDWEQKLQVSPNPPRWGLPADSKSSLHVNGFFANLAERSPPFTDCILRDIFEDIDNHMDSLRVAWVKLPPEAPGRFNMVKHLSYLYEEPQALALLQDMALDPIRLPDREEDIGVRFNAVSAIAQTAPSSEDDDWRQVLFDIVVDTKTFRLDQLATFKLRDLGVDQAQFRQGLSGRLPLSKIEELAGYTNWPEDD